MIERAQPLYNKSPLCMLCNIIEDITVSCVHSLPSVRTFTCVSHQFSLHVDSREARCNFTENEEDTYQVIEPAVGGVKIWSQSSQSQWQDLSRPVQFPYLPPSWSGTLSCPLCKRYTCTRYSPTYQDPWQMSWGLAPGLRSPPPEPAPPGFFPLKKISAWPLLYAP